MFLNWLSTIKNWHISYNNLDIWLLLKNWKICQLQAHIPVWSRGLELRKDCPYSSGAGVSALYSFTPHLEPARPCRLLCWITLFPTVPISGQALSSARICENGNSSPRTLIIITSMIKHLLCARPWVMRFACMVCEPHAVLRIIYIILYMETPGLR